MSTASLASQRQATRRVWHLAWPLILSNITVPLLGLVDTGVMGHLPDSRYLGAVTLGATLFSFLYWGFGFLRMGTTGLTAQAHGRQDADARRRLLGQGLITALVLGIVLIASHPLLVPLGLALLDGSAEVTRLADTYAAVRIASAPAVLANYVIIGWALGLGNARVTLALMLLNNSANIVLDLLFVLGLGMTVDGVALGSVIADYLTLVAGLGWVVRTLRHVGGRLDGAALRRWSAYRELLAVNGALFVRTLCLLFAMAFFNAQGAQQGDVVLAANAVLMQFILMASFGLDGFAHAAEALVGRAFGQNDAHAFRENVVAATRCSLGVALACAATFGIAGEALIAALTDLATVREAAAQYLPWVVAMPLVAVWSYLLDGIFIGATRTRAMRDTMLLAVFAVYLPVWYLTQPWGNHGLWLAFTAFMVTRSASLGLLYWRDLHPGRWSERRLAD